MQRRPALLLLRTLSLAGFAGAVLASAAAELSDAPLFDPSPLMEPAADRAEKPAEASILAAPAPPEAEELPLGSEADNGADVLLEEVRRTHPWARLQPGAWRRLRVVAESFDAAGESSGVNASERVERLLAVEANSYTLEVENLVPLAGRPAPGAAESRRLWLLTDRSIDLGSPLVEEVEPTSISFGDKVVPCRTWRVTTAVEGAVEEELLCVSVGDDPAVLRRQLTSSVGGEPGASMTLNVGRIDLPAIYAEHLTRSWRVATTITHPSGARTERSALYSADAPGGLHWEATSDYDASGRRTFWSVTELVESGRTPVERVDASDAPATPEISVEIHSRRLMRLLRRDERRGEDPPIPMQ